MRRGSYRCESGGEKVQVNTTEEESAMKARALCASVRKSEGEGLGKKESVINEERMQKTLFI